MVHTNRPLQTLMTCDASLRDRLGKPRIDFTSDLRSMEIFRDLERWQSGRMRVFAKDVTGQKLVHGFESRPLRLVKKVEANMPCFQGSLSSTSFLTSVTLLKLC